jgi:hypothetical protein
MAASLTLLQITRGAGQASTGQRVLSAFNP